MAAQTAHSDFDEMTSRLLEQLLREKRIVQPRAWKSPRGRFVLFVVALLVCVAVTAGYEFWLLGLEIDDMRLHKLPNAAQLLTAQIAVVASLFAYYQWSEARRETSLDKFYERLGLINERYFAWKGARELVPHFWDGCEGDTFERCMYVYLELDNLEYMVTRYRLGFVTPLLLQRAVRTFHWRCKSPEFTRLALRFICNAGYTPDTIELVQFLCGKAASHRE